MGAEHISERAADDNITGPVVVVLTAQHAAALTDLIIATGADDPWLDSLRRQLPAAAGPPSPPWSPATSVFAAAENVVAGARTNIAAEQQAYDVAEAADSTERIVIEAALTTARAASHERDRMADLADSAAEKVARTAAHTAVDVQLRADAIAVRVASAAAQAADTVAASIASGGDAEAALTALRLAATVDAVAVATAEETALAAAAVATAVATAAAQAALAAASAAAEFEQEVASAAAAVRILATTAARNLAAETDAKAVVTALDACLPHRF